MKLVNPSGEKTITLKPSEIKHIDVEDFGIGSRHFTLSIILEGQGAQCFVRGRAKVTDRDEKSWTIYQYFRGKNQTGTIDIRGTASDNSYLRFDGGAVLQTHSSQSNARVDERILLFDNGKGQSLPVLRVETDDVHSAGHAATVAPIDPELLLYFQSRGVAKTQAEKQIINGFLELFTDEKTEIDNE